MGYHALYLDVGGRRCVVIGENQEAEHKAALLREEGAEVVRVRGAADFQPEILDGAALVIDASLDDDLGAVVSREARARRVLVNVLDRTHLCDFIAPALVRDGPLQVAISTSGRSPFVAAHLRRMLQRFLGSRWGALTERVGGVRDRVRAEGMPLAEQTPHFLRALGDGQGRVALVGAGPGDPDLLTLRAVDLLSRAEYIFHDALIDREALAWAPPSAVRVDVGKRAGGHSTGQEEINRRMIDAARSGALVVRLKGGDPFVFGRGGEELEALTAAGIAVEVVPGVSSAIAAPALAGIPLTHRGVSSSFAVTTARLGSGAVQELRALASVETLVILMSSGSLDVIARQLIEAGRSPATPAAVIESASSPNQRVTRTVLKSMGDVRAAAPALLVVGDVVELRRQESMPQAV